MLWKYFLINAEEDIEAGRKIKKEFDTLTTKTETLLLGQRQNYDYCFPEEIWMNITKYLTFLQISKLSEVNQFFNSICIPILKNAKIEKTKVQIKIENDIIKFGSTKECSLKGLPIESTKAFISKCLDEHGLFPVRELCLEQNLAYFSKKWIQKWSIILEQIIPVRSFIVTLKLKNLHISKRDFLKYLIHSKSIKSLTFENVTFDEKVFIGTDLFDKLPTLDHLNVSQCPSIICNEASQKYADKCLYGNLHHIYSRFGSDFRDKIRPGLNLNFQNYTLKTFWIFKFLPFFYAIFTYILLCITFLKSNNLPTILASFLFPLIFLTVIAFITKTLLLSQRFQFLPQFACYFQMRLKTAQKIPFFLYPILYMFVLLLIIAFYCGNFVSCCFSGYIDEQTLIQLRIPFIGSLFYFIFSCLIFLFLNFVQKYK